jgi:hypothetical protein
MAKKEALAVGDAVVYTHVDGKQKPGVVTLIRKDGTIDVQATEENSHYQSVSAEFVAAAE